MSYRPDYEQSEHKTVCYYCAMLKYIERTRSFYGELGYKPYSWITYNEIPFCHSTRPVNEQRVTLISTAAHLLANAGDQGPGADYNAQAKFFHVFTTPVAPTPDLRISHLSYDRKHCLADDPNTWLPIQALQRGEQTGLIGELSKEVIGLPTNRNQRVTVEQDCPEVVAHCQRLKTDVVLLVPS